MTAMSLKTRFLYLVQFKIVLGIIIQHIHLIREMLL
jgi:hypothetical protein